MNAKEETAHPYERITAAIVAALKTSRNTGTLPWHQSAIHVPRNAASKQRYHGINVLALWATASVRGYESSFWATYKQWRSLGAQVRRGEKAASIVFYKQMDCADTAPNTNEDTEKRWIARASWVFNAYQVDGCTSIPTVDTTLDPVTTLHEVDAFIQGVGATVIEGGDSAFYRPSTDTIHMPDRYRLRNRDATEAYYAVLLHELIHWTGHESRLKRDLSVSFGAMTYAMEELVAEFGAAFLCADLGISSQPREDHACYVSSWIQVLEDRSRAIVLATSAATKACRYLGELSRE